MKLSKSEMLSMKKYFEKNEYHLLTKIIDLRTKMLGKEPKALVHNTGGWNIEETAKNALGEKKFEKVVTSMYVGSNGSTFELIYELRGIKEIESSKDAMQRELYFKSYNEIRDKVLKQFEDCTNCLNTDLDIGIQKYLDIMNEIGSCRGDQ